MVFPLGKDWQLSDTALFAVTQCSTTAADIAAAAAAAKLLQTCPTVRPQRQQPTRLPRPWDSPARTLEWVAISFSNA